MTVNASRAKFLPDYDASVVLRNSASAVTSTTTEASVSLKELDNAWWDDGKDIPAGTFEVHVAVSAVDVTTGDETYTFEVVVDDASAMNDSPRAVASLVFPAGKLKVGSYRLVVSSDQIKAVDDDSSGSDKFVAIKATLGGTTPSVTYNAFIGKVLSA